MKLKSSIEKSTIAAHTLSIRYSTELRYRTQFLSMLTMLLCIKWRFLNLFTVNNRLIFTSFEWSYYMMNTDKIFNTPKKWILFPEIGKEIMLFFGEFHIEIILM